MNHPKILYCAYGRAGHLVLNKLITELAVPLTDILSITYDYDENRPLLKQLEDHNIPYDTGSLKKAATLNLIRDFAPDLIISMHYRDLIPASVLELAPMGGFNLHPSLLPRYRGAFSAPWAIINGEAETGVTYHYMNEHFDDGAIILQKKLDITPYETAYMLFHRLIDLAVGNFAKAYDLVVNQGYKGTKQIGESTYYPRKLPYDGLINSEWDLVKIDSFIRGIDFPPHPPAHCVIDGIQHEVVSLKQYKELMKIE